MVIGWRTEKGISDNICPLKPYTMPPSVRCQTRLNLTSVF